MSNLEFDYERSVLDSASQLNPAFMDPPSTATRKDGEPPPKRRKTLLACDECRAKKIKCDGARPVCAACSIKDFSSAKCRYGKVNNLSVKGRIEELKNRIRHLESERQSSQPLPLSLSSPAPASGNLLGSSRNILPATSVNHLSRDRDASNIQQESRAPATFHFSQNIQAQLPSTQPPSPESISLAYSRESPFGVSPSVPSNRNDASQICEDSDKGREEVSAIVGAVTGEAQNEGFHGLSSAATFMKQIRLQVDSRAGLMSPDPDLLYTLQNNKTTQTRSSREDLGRKNLSCSYTLPPRKLADYLVNTYWTYVFPLYPFVNKRSFTESYNNIWTGANVSVPESMSSPSSSTDEATFLCIFNLVLALSCQYAEIVEAEKCQAIANEFFTRAKDLLRLDAVDSADRSVQLVQALLLMGQYLQGIGSANRAWSVIGIALRICHELGLHIVGNKAEKKSQSIMEREVVRRLYHGCLMLERMSCMNLGRPIMLSSLALDSIPLPIEADEEDLELNYHLPGLQRDESLPGLPSIPSVMSLFILSARLYRIVQRILVSLYLNEDNGNSSGYDKYFIGSDSVFQLDSDLMRWYDTVPKHLTLDDKFSSSDRHEEKDWILRRQAVVLRARFLHARIYLFRPVLSKFCTNSQYNSHVDTEEDGSRSTDEHSITKISSENMLSYRTAIQCSILCVNIARELIDVVYDNLTTKASWGQRPSWLFGVLHVYLSATVLIAVSLQPAIMSEVSKPAIESSWQRALEILRNCQSDNQSAARCVAALEILYRKLTKDPQSRLHIEHDRVHLAQVDIDELDKQIRQDQVSAPDIVSNSPFIFGDGQNEMDYYNFLTGPLWVTDFQ